MGCKFALFNSPKSVPTSKSTVVPAQNDYLQAVINTVLDGLIIIDDKGSMQSFNPAAELIFGYHPDEVIGQNVKMLMPEPYHSEHDGYLSNYLNTGEKKVIGIGREVSGKRKDGSVFPMELSVNGMQIDGEHMFVGMVRDLTEKKLMQASQYERSLIEASLDPLVTISPEGKITDVNDASVQATGIAREKLIGTDFSDYFTEPEKAQEGYQQVFSQGFVKDYPLAIRHTSGRITDVLYNASVYKDDKDNVLGVFAAARDVTVQKQAEELLQQEKLKSDTANKVKSEFLANMSHEIRTPMNAIIGLANILQNSKLDDKQKKYVTVLQTSADGLMLLINDLLDISKIESEVVELDSAPFNMSSLIEEIISAMSVRAHEKGIGLNVSYEAGLYKTYIGDSRRIHQIVLNLVSNAIKFTEHGSVSIFLAYDGKGNGNGTIAISVTDTGIGIPEDMMSNIFGKFIQADPSITRKYGGTGLGLAISKTLAEQMGGTITVTSVIGHGSTFVLILSLPVAASDNTIHTHQERIVTLDKQVNTDHLPILLVEDYEPNILVATTMLDSFGYRYEVARNGQEAIDKMSPDKYSLVLLDMQMPVMDGYETTKHIRKLEQDKGLSRVTIIAMTANALKGDKEKCLALGMDDYISKPFDPHQLQEILIKHILKNTGKIAV